MCVSINLLKNLVLIQLLKHVIVCIKFIFINEKAFPENYMKILFKINFNIIYNTKILCV